MNELTYTRCGDYYIPDLKLSEQPEAPIGKYGRMRQRYLKEHRPGLYSSLILSEMLYPHLLEIDRAARERIDAMLPRMMEAAGVTEELKARDPMRWVGLMNTLKAQAEEIILDEPYPYKKRRELCYMTMQDVVHQLFSDSVWEEFSLLNKTVDEQEITKILRRLDLLDYKDKHPMTLSGGQKQRLALAVATLANKDIMIFDEPTSGLDYGNMIKVCELIKELSSNRIVFVATHDRELMGLLCTRRMEISNESISVYDLTTK